MSIDTFGRVVVGGARFAENGERIFTAAQIAARGAEQITPAICRFLEAAGANPGHVMVANGHLPPHLRQLVQEATIARANNQFHLEFNQTQQLQIDRVPHARDLVRRASNPCLMEINHNDREREYRDRLDAYREHNDAELRRLGKVGVDAGLMVGCAAAGDAQGAMENGINAALGLAEPVIEASKSFWESAKSLFGFGD